MTYCKICGRSSSNGSSLCRYHQDALECIQSSYERWRKASGVSWEEYIERLCQIEETGRWVLDVVEQIRSGNDFSATT